MENGRKSELQGALTGRSLEKAPGIPSEPEAGKTKFQPLSDQEAGEVSGGTRPPPSAYHDHPFF